MTFHDATNRDNCWSPLPVASPLDSRYIHYLQILTPSRQKLPFHPFTIHTKWQFSELCHPNLSRYTASLSTLPYLHHRPHLPEHRILHNDVFQTMADSAIAPKPKRHTSTQISQNSKNLS